MRWRALFAVRMRRLGKPLDPAPSRRGLAWVLAVGSLVLAIALFAVPRPAVAAPPGEAADKQWIKHRVVQKETLDWIAERYGVTRPQIVRWNKKAFKEKEWIYAGQRLAIHAPTPVRPARARITYKVRRGDTWAKIARNYDIPLKQLRAWNSKVPKAFRAGTRLVVWTNPKPLPPSGRSVEEEVAFDEDGNAVPAEDLPEIAVGKGGLSVGLPNRGKLVGGIQLPESEMYVVRDEAKAYGSSHAIEHMLEAFAAFRAATGYRQPLVIGAISLEHGGRFRPHKSHQSGRDLDVRMPRKKGRKRIKSVSDINWGATWALIKALEATGEVEYIFMSSSRQKILYKAAKARGATRAELARLIQYPRKARSNKGLVRHSKGHDSHIHVRFKCAADNKRCESY